jgi:hypothetical protein
MNADEMNCERIEEPEAAERFVQARCERGRISCDVMANLGVPSSNSAVHRNKPETRVKLRSQYTRENRKTALAAPSTRRSVQFFAALYIHTLMLMILVVFSRNMFSTAIRTVLLPLFR